MLSDHNPDVEIYSTAAALRLDGWDPREALAAANRLYPRYAGLCRTIDVVARRNKIRETRRPSLLIMSQGLASLLAALAFGIHAVAEDNPTTDADQ